MADHPPIDDIASSRQRDRRPAHLRISASSRLRRSAGRRWLGAGIASACATVCALVWWPAAAAAAGCTTITLAGLWQIARASSWEHSLRAYSGIGMILAGMWGVLLAATGRADWPLAATASAAALLASWLVWAPHSHPALLRHTTGFGDLDPPHPASEPNRSQGATPPC